eukprot:scaffold1034_cov127-Cylindrotheca_fusiformis.AAC.30
MGNLLVSDSCWDGSSGQPKKSSILHTPTPKHRHRVKLLFGCQTEEEHRDYVKEICEAIANMHGEEGLQVVGLEYRFWHNPNTCNCAKKWTQQLHHPKVRAEEEKKAAEEDHASSQLSQQDSDADRGRKNSTKTYEHKISDLSFGTDDADFFPDEADKKSNDESDEAHDDDDSSSSDEQARDISRSFRELSIQHEEFMVPIGEPLSRTSSATDLNQQFQFGTRQGSDRSVQTTTTMFSLKTHHSRASGTTTTSKSSVDDDSTGCSLRLFHKSTNTPITDKNHELFLAHGKMYDEVARLCMEYAQSVMLREGNLEWQNMGRGVGAMVSKDRCSATKKPVLLVVTGKGKVAAGIFSRRHLMTNGLEISTALPYLREAKERNMQIAILDPNVNGSQEAMNSVTKSLERLFLEEEDSAEDIYILAHSMAGSQLVRFLHGKTHRKEDEDTPSDYEIRSGLGFLQQIKAVAFTDSNHNINWIKNNPPVSELVQGPSSLYIKSHKVHEDSKVLGELHHDCEFWKHRFGSIKTIWAGTKEHSLTNYTGMPFIWDHFDTFLEGSGSGRNEQEGSTSR